MSLVLRLFKGAGADQFRTWVEAAVVSMGGTLRWGEKGERDSDFRLTSQGDVHAAYLPYLSGRDWDFFKKLGEISRLPWIEVRIQEGSLWDYSLYRGTENIDNFSVCPQYWADSPEVAAVILGGSRIRKLLWKTLFPNRYSSVDEHLTTYRGNASVLASTWGLPVERIERYLVNWGYKSDPSEGTFDFTLSGRAYPEDEYCYGEYEQFFDFLRVLGGVDPQDRHKLELPVTSPN